MDSAADADTIVGEIIEWIAQDRAAEELDVIEVRSETALLDEGIFDSMKVLEFVKWLESRYDISIGVDQLTAQFFASPQTVADEVLKLRAEG